MQLAETGRFILGSHDEMELDKLIEVLHKISETLTPMYLGLPAVAKPPQTQSHNPIS